MWYFLFFTLLKILLIVIPVMGLVAYYTLAERKVIGFIQVRVGPQRTGYRGILQPIADGLKLLTKELIIPSAAHPFLFLLAPVLALVPALLGWAVIPFDEEWVLAHVDAGVLYLLAMTSLGVYGVIFGGWASNSKYAILGALRSAAQVISYEIAMGFALISILLLAGSTNLSVIIQQQSGGVSHWFVWPLFPVFLVYWICAVAETNRAPFDVAEGESEIVAGFHVEYSGILFGLFFLAEYANMLLISLSAAIFFLGGWLSPFEGIPILARMTSWVPGIVWLGIKGGIFAFLYLWLRATFPRYRYDQIMRLGWKILIPVALVWLLVVAVFVLWRGQ